MCVVVFWLALQLADSQPARSQQNLQPAPVNRGRAARNVLLAPVAVNAQPMAAQLRRHLEPMLIVELSFVNRAADLNEQERRELIAASVRWFDEFAVDFLKNPDRNEQRMLLQGVQGFVIGPERAGKDPRELIQSGVAKIVTVTLPSEKAAAYESESAKRDSFYREVTIANLVERIDEKLLLSTEQRTNIARALIENWDSGQIPQAEIFMVSTNALPAAVEMWIRSELNESQREVLNKINKLPSRMFYGGAALGAEGDVIGDIDLNAQGPPEND